MTKKFFTDNREWFTRTSLVALAGLVGIYALGRVGVVVTNPATMLIFLTMGLLAWTVATTLRSVGEYTGRKTGVMACTLPASVASKFALALAVSLGSIAAFALAVWGLNSLAGALDWMHLTKEQIFGSAAPSFGTVVRKLSGPVGAAAFVSAIVMLIKLSVRRGGFGRQAAIGAAVAAAVVVLVVKLPEWCGLPQTSTDWPFFFDLGLWVYGGEGAVRQTVSWATGWLHGAIADAGTLSIPVVFWVASYFKLKEIEP